jgi:hypothetical protein
MKIDHRVNKLSVSRDQRFFLSCWFNLVHAFSLDSFRVRTMNSDNSLRELKRIFKLGKPEEIKLVRDEVVEIISNDILLEQELFRFSRDQLLEALREKDLEKNEQHKSMALYFVNELSSIISKMYTDQALKYLHLMLVENLEASMSEVERFKRIEGVTNYLLSTLLDRDASLESLFSLYAQILVPRRQNGKYVFEKSFGLLRNLLLETPKIYRIILAIENVSKQVDFPPQIGDIKFLSEPPCSQDKEQKASTYLTPAPRKLFSIQDVEARDARGAGAIAFDNLNDILNLVRFEYEREHVSTPSMFAFTTTNSSSSAKVFALPMVVPNPSREIDGPALAAFVDSVNELVTSERFELEGRDRVLSAFRLYRTGLDTPILANKLMNWWTAIEFLVRGTSSKGSIGTSVEMVLSPVLCRTYVSKLLLAIRSVLLDMKVSLIDPKDGLTISLRGMTPVDLYNLFLKDGVQAAILRSADEEPYVGRHIARFFEGLNDPKAMYKLLNSHETRIRRHLQRLWRARCDVVHSAKATVSTALLCACLEFYIKTALMSLLRALRKNTTLASAKEFFDRETHSHKRIKAALASGDDQLLRQCLADGN